MSQNGQQEQVVQNGQPNKELFDELIEPGMDDTLPQPVANLLSKDFPLSKIRRSDREYFRLLQENIMHYATEQYPPQDSLVQGALGAALLEDPDYDLSALTPEKRNELRSLLMVTHARSSRGEGGWQQDKLGESIQTRRVEDNREQEDTGIIGGMFS